MRNFALGKSKRSPQSKLLQTLNSNGPRLQILKNVRASQPEIPIDKVANSLPHRTIRPIRSSNGANPQSPRLATCSAPWETPCDRNFSQQQRQVARSENPRLSTRISRRGVSWESPSPSRGLALPVPPSPFCEAGSSKMKSGGK